VSLIGTPQIITLAEVLSVTMGAGIYLGTVQEVAFDESREPGHLFGNQIKVSIDEQLVGGKWDSSEPAWTVGSVQGVADGIGVHPACANGDPAVGKHVLLFPWTEPLAVPRSPLGMPVKLSSLRPRFICISDQDDVVFDDFLDGEGLAERATVPLSVLRQAIAVLANEHQTARQRVIESCGAQTCETGLMCFFGVACLDVQLADGLVEADAYNGGSYGWRPDGFVAVTTGSSSSSGGFPP